MPRYDMQCNHCGKEFEHTCRVSEMTAARCPKCDLDVRVVIKTLPARDWFRPHWNENFETDPVWVESKQHYKKLCLKHDVTSEALGDVRNITEI